MSRWPGQRRSDVLWHAARVTAAWAAIAALAAAIGLFAVVDRKYGLIVAALVLVVGVFAADPILLVVAAFPGIFLLERVGGGGTNLAVADALVFVGALVCLLHIRWKEAHHLRQFLVGILVYEATLILIVAVHPNRYDIVEWFHRMSYLAGSVLIGWVLARTGRARQAFRLYLLGASIIALLAMEHAVTLHFKPAQWGLYQKNAIGAMMWVAIVVTQVNPSWTGVSRRQARVVKILCILGLLASQSRQAMVVLIGVLCLAALMNPEVRRRSKLMLLGIIPLAGFLYYDFTTQAKNNPKFNTVAIRLDQYAAALKVWHLSPIFGEGMRFYNLPQFSNVGVPPSVIIENLAASGIVGSIAFLACAVLLVRAVVKLPREVGLLGLLVLCGHLTEGLFDIFWIGAYSAAPMIVVGVAIGMADMVRCGIPLPGRSGDRAPLARAGPAVAGGVVGGAVGGAVAAPGAVAPGAVAPGVVGAAPAESSSVTSRAARTVRSRLAAPASRRPPAPAG